MTENSSPHRRRKADVSESSITLKVKHIWSIIMTIVGITAALGMGWFELKAEAAEARRGVDSLNHRVARIECLIEQQTTFAIYGVKPAHACL